MECDPISEVIDEPLFISEKSLLQLQIFRAADKFIDLPGVDTTEERERLSALFNELLDHLISGIEQNPSKLWVMKQFQLPLTAMGVEDTEAREHFGVHLERLMDILGIDSSDGLLNYYLSVSL